MFCSKEKRDPDEKLVAPADFQIPTNKRGCTDVLFTLLLLAMWGGMSYLGYSAFLEGDYRIIVNPLDYDGNVCGMDYNGKDMTEYPFLYYVNFVSGGVCVKECPDLTPSDQSNATLNLDPYTLVTYDGVFQLEGFATLDPNFIQVADYSNSSNTKSCTVDKCFPELNPVTAFFSDEGINQGYGYAFYLLDTVSFLNRCFPTIESFKQLQNTTEISFFDTKFIDFNELESIGFYERFYGDCYRARVWILGLGFGAALVSFL